MATPELIAQLRALAESVKASHPAAFVVLKTLTGALAEGRENALARWCARFIRLRNK